MNLRSGLGACLVLVIGSGSACSTSTTPTPTDATTHSSTHSTTQGTTDSRGRRTTVLETGKSNLPLSAGTYRSPAGFEPVLRITVSGSGWRSTHRGTDGFDVSRPDPTRDAPLVAVVVATPREADAEAALAAVRARAEAAGATIRPPTSAAGAAGSIIDVRGGEGPLVSSAEDGITLDAGAGQRLSVVGLDIDGHAVLVAVFVPDQTRWPEAIAAAKPLLRSITSS